jgi:hypothetical protein
MVTLGDVYQECGHLYVSKQGYVHMHWYVSDTTVADYVARRLPAYVRKHRQILVVTITKRAHLATACRQLSKYALGEPHKQELALALRYAVEKDKAKRLGLAAELKALLDARRHPSDGQTSEIPAQSS